MQIYSAALSDMEITSKLDKMNITPFFKSIDGLGALGMGGASSSTAYITATPNWAGQAYSSNPKQLIKYVHDNSMSTNGAVPGGIIDISTGRMDYGSQSIFKGTMADGTPDGTNVVADFSSTISDGGFFGDGTTPVTAMRISASNGATIARNSVEIAQNITRGSTAYADYYGTIFGTGKDAQIYYDGTNLIVNPKLVGTGALNINGSMILTPAATDPATPVKGQLYYNSASDNLKLYNGAWVTITTSSSLRYKHDIQSLADDWSKILQVQPKSFIYNGDADTATSVGYIAEDFDALGLKDLVQYDSQNRPNGINYDRITLYDTEMIKQQQLEINMLKQRLGISTSGVSINPAGTVSSGSVLGVDDQSLKSSLTNLGATLAGGVMSLKQIIADSITVKTADIAQINIQKMQIVDQTTGDIYCTWLSNGEWQKVKGSCSTTDIQTTSATQSTQTSAAEESAEATIEAAIQSQQAAIKSQTAAVQSQVSAIQSLQAKEKAQSAADAAQQAAQQVQAQILDISSVSSIADINVLYGTAVNSLGLPTIVAATLSDSTTQNIAVTWDGATPTYDANTVGTYAFSGSLTPSGNITNTKNLKASVNVVVAQQEVPASAADVSGTIGDLIQIRLLAY